MRGQSPGCTGKRTKNFLGFTHICGTNRQTGNFTVHRQTIGKRMAAKRKDIRATLCRRMHGRVAGTLQWLQQVVRGPSYITPFRATGHA
jgi:hypothetical protein